MANEWADWMSATPPRRGNIDAEGLCAALVGSFRLFRNIETLTQIVCGENYLEVDRKAVAQGDVEATVTAARTQFDEVAIETKLESGRPHSIIIGLKRTANLHEMCRDGQLAIPFVVALLEQECRELNPNNRPAAAKENWHCLDIPDATNLEQWVRVVVRYIEARPQRMHEPFLPLALEALFDAWPSHK